MGMETPPGLIVPNYMTAPAPRRTAAAVRWVMLAVAILALAATVVLLFNPALELNDAFGGGVLGTPFAPIDGINRPQTVQPQYSAQASFFLGIFLLMQWLFLSSRGSWRLRMSLEGPPPRRAALAAGFMGMLLSIGLIATLMELPDWWLRFTARDGADGKSGQHFGVVWIIMIAFWVFWTFVFHRYWKSLDRYTALRKVIRWLIAGTILELIIAAPAHAIILNERGGDCYCARGTWTGVAFGATVALWLFGPGAFLLFLREKRRRDQLI